MSKIYVRARIPRMSTKAAVLMSMMSSRDVDEILFRIDDIDITLLEFAKSVYEGYQRLHSRTGGSLSYYCTSLSFRAKDTSPAFFKNWYNIYRHFCVRANMDPWEIVGVEYKILKFIAESGIKILNKSTTVEIIEYLKEQKMSQADKWEYVRKTKNEMKEIHEMFRNKTKTNA